MSDKNTEGAAKAPASKELLEAVHDADRAMSRVFNLLYNVNDPRASRLAELQAEYCVPLQQSLGVI